MPCYHPLTAWRSRERGPTGKQVVVFDRREAVSFSFTLPCGQCIGCRLERSRQWAMRCVHEASLHDENCFITLTYDDEHLPSDGSLNKKHFQDFMKRLRKRVGDRRIRFYHCGEYGELYRRPHYHALLFGFDFGDKTLFTVRNENRIHTSEFLDSVWQRGYSSIGDVTFDSAAYVARYVMKKVNGEAAAEHYIGCDSITGDLVDLVPEYTTMSRGGKGGHGIGHDWYSKFKEDVFPLDEVVIRGRRMKPPRFYDLVYELECPEDFARVKAERVVAALRGKADCTPERLAVREYCKEVEVSRLVRGVDDVT